jgi:hypothetical protein
MHQTTSRVTALPGCPADQFGDSSSKSPSPKQQSEQRPRVRSTVDPVAQQAPEEHAYNREKGQFER